MGRPCLPDGVRKVLTDAERIEYHRQLYRKSERERLYRINHARRQRGAPEIASLAETKLRIPLESR